MQRRFAWAGGLVLGIGLMIISRPADAVIMRLTPLREVLATQQLIFMAKVEKIDPSRPGMILAIDADLKGKAPFRRMAVNLTGDSEGKREKHAEQLLKRVEADLPIVVFAGQRGNRYTAFGYTNGTWFQVLGQADKDSPDEVRWAFTHCEPYLRRTFKGTTADLRQVITDGLKGAKAPPDPEPNEKPGLGPEVAGRGRGSRIEDRGSKIEDRGLRTRTRLVLAATFDPLSSIFYPQSSIFGVIPSFVGVGVLSLLAALFPAVFGGLALAMKRWMVLLSVASIDSTLYWLHGWFYPRIRGSWWGAEWALWAAMSAIALVGAAWSWRRYRNTVRDGGETGAVPSRKEQKVLWGMSLVGLVIVLVCLWRGVLGEPAWTALAVAWVAVWVGAVYAMILVLVARSRPALKPALATEGVMLGACGLAFAGLAWMLLPKQPVNAFTVQAGANNQAGNHAPRLSVAWHFEPEKGAGQFISSPLVAGDRVYVASAQFAGLDTFGVLYCLDRVTGKQLWTFNDDGAMKQVSVSSPCLANGRLYIGEGFHQDKDCKLYCIAAATGKKLWEFQTTSHTESSPSVADGKVFVGAGDDGIYCLDANTGRELWHFEHLHVDAMLALAGDRLYGGSGVGDLFNETQIFCLDAATGKPQWRVPIDLPVWGSPVAAGDEVFFPLGNGNFLQSADANPGGAILCVQARDGRRKWRRDVPDGVLVQPALDARSVYFASRDRNCYCVDRAEGRVRWKQDLGSPVVAKPVVHGSEVYVVASGGRVACLDAATGESRWGFDVAEHSQTKPQLLSSPVVAAEPGASGSRRLYFGAGLDNGKTPTLYCLEEDRESEAARQEASGGNPGAVVR